MQERRKGDTYVYVCVCANICFCGQYDGQKGVELMLQTIHDEFRRCMQLTGCTSVKEITNNSLARIDADGMLKRF